jgi:hypothetical protein
MGLKSFIVALIILEIGLFIIRQIGTGFLASVPVVSGISDTVKSFSAMLDLFLMALGAIIIVLAAVALLKRGPKAPKAPKEVPAPYETEGKAEEKAEEELGEQRNEETEANAAEEPEEETEEEHMRKG